MARYDDWGTLPDQLEGAIASGRMAGELSRLVPATADLSSAAKRDAALAELLAAGLAPMGWVDATASAYGLDTANTAAANTTALNAALAAAETGGVVYLRPGTYSLNPVTAVAKPLTVFGPGAILQANTLTDELGLLTFAGSVSAVSTTLTSGVTVGALTLPVSDTTAFTVGRWVRIEDTSASASAFEYEYAKVIAKDATNLYLAAPLEVPVTYPGSASGVVTELSMLSGVSVQGVSFDLNSLGGTNVSGLQLDYCVDSEVVGCKAYNFDYNGIEIRRSKHVTVLGGFYGDSTGDLAAGAPPNAGYGIHVSTASSHIVVNGIQSRQCRHGVILATGSHHLTVQNCAFHGMYSSAVETHFRRALNVVFANNVVNGTTFRQAGQLTAPTDASYGLLASTTDTQVVFTGNVIANIRGAGLRWSQSSLADAHGIVVGNVLVDCEPTVNSESEGSLYVAKCAHLTIGDNMIVRNGVIDSSGLKLVGCEDVELTGNHVDFTASQTSTNEAFTISNCKRVVVSGNSATITGSSSRAFRVLSTASGDSDTIRFVSNRPNVASGSTYLVDANATNVSWEGSQVVGNWTDTDVADAQTNAELTRAMGRWIAPRSGSVTAVVAALSEARTAGTLTVTVFKNTGLAGAAGSSIGLTAVIDATNTSRKVTTQARDVDTFAAGDELYICVTTASWTPTTSDLTAALEVVLD